jgi:chromosomal replication initiation ATPase DnaA|tara:strand:+ start:3331 stop:3630 length:300 start_codon:yes stop_codon:yes gene_type:complete
MKYKLFKKFIERILEHMEISHADLFDKSRKKSVVEARQLLYYLCHNRGMGVVEIKGYMFREGHTLEHTTISHGINNITQAIESDPDLQLIANNIQEVEV